MPRKTTPAELAALARTLNQVAAGSDPAGAELVAAVRVLCRTLGERHPGGTLELRVPPYAAVQLGIGQRGAHTRGTPPKVAGPDPHTLLRLAGGALPGPGPPPPPAVAASGPHAELGEVFPVTLR